MIEIGYEYSQIYEKYIPIYKFDNVIFKRIEQFIRLPRWVDRIKYENQTGVYSLITILQSFPCELLTNMIQIKKHYKRIYLDYDKLMNDITFLQKFYTNTLNCVGGNQQKENYYVNNIDLINAYLEKCMFYYNKLREIWKIVSLRYFKNTLLDDLYYIMDCREYERYKRLLMCDSSKTEDLEHLIEYGRNIIIGDWQKQLSSISTCCNGDSFSFLVHIGYDKNVTQNFVSSTLLTNNLWCTYGGDEVGFIMETKKIIAAYARDIFSDNYALSVEDVIPQTPVPNILSKQRIEKECLRDLAEHGDAMSEIITEGFNPSALFYIESNSSNRIKQSKVNQVLELHDIFLDLPIVKINKETHKVKVLKNN